MAALQPLALHVEEEGGEELQPKYPYMGHSASCREHAGMNVLNDDGRHRTRKHNVTKYVLLLCKQQQT